MGEDQSNLYRKRSGLLHGKRANGEDRYLLLLTGNTRTSMRMSQTAEQLQATILHDEGQFLTYSCGKLVEIVKEGPIFTFVQLPTGELRGVLNEYLQVYR